MSGFAFDFEPIPAQRAAGPIGTSQTFDIGDPVMYTSGLLVTAPADGTEILVADGVVGFALEPAEGIRAGSRAADSATAALAAGMNQSTNRTYARANGGLRLRTTVSNFWATTAAGTEEPIVAADIGLRRQISCENATNNWGIEDTAGAPGTDMVAQLLEPINSDGLPIRLFGGTGANWIFNIEAAVS
jgi:hypothetical protein